MRGGEVYVVAAIRARRGFVARPARLEWLAPGLSGVAVRLYLPRPDSPFAETS